MTSTRRHVCLGSATVLLAATLAVGCRREVQQTSPEAVVQEFIVRMKRVHGERKPALRAYELLWSEARANLQERARRASALSGRKVGPEEMLAPSVFHLAFEPVKYQTRLEGRWAVVTVGGPKGEERTVRCIAENGEWRLVLELPPLAPIRRRQADE